MNIFRSRLLENSGGQTGTTVYIDGVKSKASRIDLDEIIPMPYTYANDHNVGNSPIKGITYQNEIHIMGGVTHWTDHYKWNGTSWVSVSTPPNITLQQCIVYNDKIYAFGILSGKKIYCWDENSWTTISQPSGSKANYVGCGVTVYNDKIHLIGNSYGHCTYDGTSWESATNPSVTYIDNCMLFSANGELHFINAYYWDDCHFVTKDGANWQKSERPLFNHVGGFEYNNKILLLGLHYAPVIESLDCMKKVIIP